MTDTVPMTPRGSALETAQTATASLRRYVESRAFSGYDPYDAMNSPLLRALTLGLPKGRIFWTQILRRLPVNLRPLLGIRPGRNPKALGLFLMSYTRLLKLDPSGAVKPIIDDLIRGLRETRSTGYSGHAWGYNFDWQSRAAYVPRGTPTIVNTAFIGHALLDAHDALGLQEALDLAVPTADFMLRDLKRKTTGPGFCFSYTPLDENYVHNANLLGASLLIRLHAKTGNTALREAALESLSYSMAHQHEDGSWSYAETPFQKWCDSFHTGFNLQAIRVFLRLGEADHTRDAYARGVDYYAKHFFLADGTPKYYDVSVYPIDIHAPAQAVAFFSTMGPTYAALTDTILQWMAASLFDPRRGYFYFRRGRFMVNRIPFMRWSQAWGLHALTSYERSRKQDLPPTVW